MPWLESLQELYENMLISDYPNAVAHIDADHFFVNCELARNPQLRGKPVMVLGKLGSCILAKTPEAKAMGITTAMPLWDAKKLCPQGIYLQGDFRYYTLLSRQLMSLLKEWSPMVETYSLDEAFLDLKGLRGMYRKTYEQIADTIRLEVQHQLGITVSVGVSVNKLLAKMACETRKPNGTRMVPGRSIREFLSPLPISDIPGIGRARTALLNKYRVYTALDLARAPEQKILRWFGKTGLLLWRELRGETSFPLSDKPPPPKSITRTSSFDHPTKDINWVHGMAVYHLERSIEALYRHRLAVGEISLYLRTKTFHTFGNRHQFEIPTNNFYELVRVIQNQIQKLPPKQIWRSTGVILTKLKPASGRQLNLFEDPKKLIESEQINKAKLKINERFGRTTVRSGATLLVNSKCKKKRGMNMPII